MIQGAHKGNETREQERQDKHKRDKGEKEGDK